MSDETAPPRASPLVYYLHAAESLAPAERSDDYPTELNGQPVAYFWADAIRTGRYVHPTGHFELSVDVDRLDQWAHNFRRMRDAGVDVPVPVDHSTSARDNLGFVVDVRRDGQTLRVLHQLIGNDAIALASRNKVSLAIDPDFRDGRGNAYGDCVVHSSLTPNPLVPGQPPLTPLSAATSANRPTMVFELSTRPPSPTPTTTTPDPLHAAHADLLSRRADALVTGGHITPACRDRLVKLFARDQAAPNWLLLSREGNGSNNPGVAPLDDLLDALSQNRALPLGERTGLQSLTRPIPGDPAPTDDLTTRMARMASGK